MNDDTSKQQRQKSSRATGRNNTSLNITYISSANTRRAVPIPLVLSDMTVDRGICWCEHVRTCTVLLVVAAPQSKMLLRILYPSEELATMLLQYGTNYFFLNHFGVVFIFGGMVSRQSTNETTMLFKYYLFQLLHSPRHDVTQVSFSSSTIVFIWGRQRHRRSVGCWSCRRRFGILLQLALHQDQGVPLVMLALICWSRGRRRDGAVGAVDVGAVIAVGLEQRAPSVLEQRVLSVLKGRELSVLEQWAGCFCWSKGRHRCWSRGRRRCWSSGRRRCWSSGCFWFWSGGCFQCWSRGAVGVRAEGAFGVGAVRAPSVVVLRSAVFSAVLRSAGLLHLAVWQSAKWQSAVW